MAEKSFDPLLRQALLDASYLEYQSLWEAAEDPAFSPRYLRWRLRLLSDPFGWMKKQLRPLWVRILRTAACLLIVSVLALGSLVAVSPTVRAAVLNWLREISGNHVTYTSPEAPSPKNPPSWYPTFLPEGWSLEEAEGRSSRAEYCFAGKEGRVTFRCAYPSGGSFGFSPEEEMVQNRRKITVQGYPADLYEGEEQTYLIWQGQDGVLFSFSGNKIATEDLLNIAESLNPAPGSMPEYQLSYMPEGFVQYEQSTLPTAVQEIWMGSDTSLTLLYSFEAVTVPEGAGEMVTVNGLEAQYWGAEEPYEAGESSMAVNGEEVEGSQTETGGVMISSGTIVGPNGAGVNTLAWTDPDAGLHFRLHSTVGRETLLRVAEGISAPDTPSSNASFGEIPGD